MPEIVVIGSALLHASWNGIAHRINDKLVGFALINVAITVCAAVMVCFTPFPAAAAWPYILVSGALEVAYQLLLLRAYQLGDFGQMYPIARGTAPLLVAVISIVLLGQPLSPGELLGVAVISAGLAILAFSDGIPGRAQLPAITAAVGTGVMIAAYTVVDGTGVRQAGTVSGYIAWMFLCHGPVVPLIAWAMRGRGLVAQMRPVYKEGLIGGVLSLTAYGLVIWAQSRGSLATIAALRETSVVFGALIATLLFHERLGPLRLTASATVALGAILLQVTHS